MLSNFAYNEILTVFCKKETKFNKKYNKERKHIFVLLQSLLSLFFFYFWNNIFFVSVSMNIISCTDSIFTHLIFCALRFIDCVENVYSGGNIHAMYLQYHHLTKSCQWEFDEAFFTIRLVVESMTNNIENVSNMDGVYWNVVQMLTSWMDW